MSASDSNSEKPFSILTTLLKNNNLDDNAIDILIKKKSKDVAEQDDISLAKFLAFNDAEHSNFNRLKYNNLNSVKHNDINNVKYNDFIRVKHNGKKLQSHNKKPIIKDNFNFFANAKFKKYVANIKKSSKKSKILQEINVPHIAITELKSQSIMPNDDTYDDFNMNDIKPKLDDELFMENMNKVNPLKKGGRVVHPKNKIIKNKSENPAKNIEFILSNQQDYIQGHVVGFDALNFSQFQNGFYSIEARLDLHGLNSIQAYAALLNFIKLSWHKNLGSLLIVCGRGRNSISGFAVLRYKLQEWLILEPFKNVVFAFCSARPCDGGVGCLYVLLRKYNRKNKINWNITPLDDDLFQIK